MFELTRGRPRARDHPCSKLILFSHESESGIEIPYPAIAIHAIQSLSEGEDQKPVVWMQLELWDPEVGDDEYGDPIELTLALAPASNPPSTSTVDPDDTTSKPPPTAREQIQTFYNAITACAELHPDPADEDPEDDFDRIIFEGGGKRIVGLPGAYKLGSDLPPPLPGSSGWITADNVSEFFDEDGNWIGGGDAEEYDGGEMGEDGGDYDEADEGVVEGVSGELGEGAGHVRDRDEVKREEAKAEQNGVDAKEDKDENEAKKPRIE